MPNTIWSWLLWMAVSLLLYAPVLRWCWYRDGAPADGIGTPWSWASVFVIAIPLLLLMRYLMFTVL